MSTVREVLPAVGTPWIHPWGAVRNRLLQNFTVAVPPVLLHSEKRVSIVLSVNYKMPEGTSEKDSELKSMFELDYWNNIPADWKPRYIGTKLNGKFVSIHL